MRNVFKGLNAYLMSSRNKYKCIFCFDDFNCLPQIRSPTGSNVADLPNVNPDLPNLDQDLSYVDPNLPNVDLSIQIFQM